MEEQKEKLFSPSHFQESGVPKESSDFEMTSTN
jgi:hypothetical protein